MKEQTVSEAHFVIYVYEDEDEGEVDDDDVGHERYRRGRAWS